MKSIIIFSLFTKIFSLNKLFFLKKKKRLKKNDLINYLDKSKLPIISIRLQQTCDATITGNLWHS